MIKRTVIILGLVFLALGCSKAEPKPQKKQTSHVNSETDTQKQKYIYNNNFHVKYSKRKVIWFAPYITNNGDVVSERTVSILPAYPTWSDEKARKVKISKEILEFLSEHK